MFVRFAVLAILLTLVLCKYQSNEVVEGIDWRLPKCKNSTRSDHLQRVLKMVKKEIKKKKEGPRYSCNLQKFAHNYTEIDKKFCYFKTLSASEKLEDIADKVASKIYDASSKISSYHSAQNIREDRQNLEKNKKRKKQLYKKEAHKKLI